jgi:hypothetical protein
MTEAITLCMERCPECRCPVLAGPQEVQGYPAACGRSVFVASSSGCALRKTPAVPSTRSHDEELVF